MTKRHYVQSLGILLAATYYVKNVLQLHWYEAFGLVFLAIVCVLHTNDVMNDIRMKKEKRKREQREWDEHGSDDPDEAG